MLFLYIYLFLLLFGVAFLNASRIYCPSVHFVEQQFWDVVFSCSIRFFQ